MLLLQKDPCQISFSHCVSSFLGIRCFASERGHLWLCFGELPAGYWSTGLTCAEFQCLRAYNDPPPAQGSPWPVILRMGAWEPSSPGSGWAGLNLSLALGLCGTLPEISYLFRFLPLSLSCISLLVSLEPFLCHLPLSQGLFWELDLTSPFLTWYPCLKTLSRASYFKCLKPCQAKEKLHTECIAPNVA